MTAQARVVCRRVRLSLLSSTTTLAPKGGVLLQELTAAAERGIQRIRSIHHLAFSFLRYCDLSLW
jgi:hypothetical protein